ncbi:MAG TPA: type II toxin-antitoxin system VapC family toxin [Mycobacteriales bacterium]|jgi:PIN domain nuclease of toxin-antitoxin system|nr:type II toxin-antitoxin system VapC family toxin [Mycobacteriales bacterium]
MIVLDASAVAALLFEEPGGDRVADVIAAGDAAMSAVNFSEVAALLMRRQVQGLIAIMGDLEHQVEVIAFDMSHALQAAFLTPVTASQGLGIGDRACLALGLALQSPVLTADRMWAAISDAAGVKIELLRSSS